MKRQQLFFFLFGVVGLIYILRLFTIQLLDPSYKLSADNNAKRIIKVYPPRGFIYDRNGELLVANQVAYDLMVIPRQVKAFDTTQFARLLSIDRAYVKSELTKARVYSPYRASVFLKMLTVDDYARVQERLNDYRGFFVQRRILRDYTVNYGANVFGFIGEVTDLYIKDHPEYEKGDLVGQAGIEKAYEEVLRGKAGVQYRLVDNFNREMGPYMDGQFDQDPLPGKDVTSTIDGVLQAYGEALMSGKRGSIVAIEPATGEILALVTAPSYRPSALVGRKRSRNYAALYRDSINKPLYDRGLLAEYPPGSPFKLMNALIGLETHAITADTRYTCNHGFHFGSLRVGCHCSGGSMALQHAITTSCNNYFCTTYKAIIEKFPTARQGMDAWSNHVKSFGMGKFLGSDLPTGRKGFVPDAAFYTRIYGGTSWRAVTTISNGIGQGELLVTPMQLANMTAAIANRGHWYIPHIIKKVGKQPVNNPDFFKKQRTTVHPKYFEVVINGMFDVFEIGTAAGSKVKHIQMCGKTGTAENPHGQDHSIFVAFAPKDNPKIALAMIVENGYWGARWAAPISSLMIEKYLTDSISRPDLERRMLEGNLQGEYGMSTKTKLPL